MRCFSDVAKGSPPRVRGEAIDALLFGCGKGITPACAGRRLAQHRAGRIEKDHPRVCGEKNFRTIVL